MVSEDNRMGLYVAVPVYFLMLGGATYWAYRRMERMEHTGASDKVSKLSWKPSTRIPSAPCHFSFFSPARSQTAQKKLTAHYLGGRDFGPLLTAGTLFASLFSGYTVIGVPNEAFKLGWESLRWIPSLLGICLGYFGTGIRLRKSGLLRNHQSPVDFITDRYQSQLLRYTIVSLQIIPTIVYLAAQVIAIKRTFNSIFELDDEAVYPVIIIMFMILIFEWVGGLSSVALTDSFQAIVMILSFIVLPIVILKNFGGWQDLNPSTYPQPQFYQTLSKDSQWEFWQLSLVNFSFFTLPHLMQRTYAAKDLKSLKLGYTIMTLGPWFTTFVGVFMGTVGVSILANANDGEAQDPASPFTAIIEEIMNLGGFAKGAGIVTITASLAAIMSTADSLIIAISQLVTVEIIYPLSPSATPSTMARWGRLSSFVAVVVALLIGIFWTDGMTDLGEIQFPLSAQAVPAFLIGLYSYNHKTDIHPWCIASGAIAATVYVVVFYFGYLKGDDSPLAINAGVTGFAVQFAVAIVLELIRRLLFGVYDHIGDEETVQDETDGKESETELLYPGRPKWDIPALDRFGERTLTHKLVWKSMEGTNEPMANPWWVFMILFALSICTPLVESMSPPMDSDGTSFVYPPSIVNGLPWWAFKIIMLSIVPTILLIVAIRKMPDEFPIDEKRIEMEGIDPALVEMTKEELNRRSSYDEHNLGIRRRRSTISQEMDRLGLTGESQRRLLSLKQGSEEGTTTRSQRRLASLAMQSSRSLKSITPIIEEEIVLEDIIEDMGV